MLVEELRQHAVDLAGTGDPVEGQRPAPFQPAQGPPDAVTVEHLPHLVLPATDFNRGTGLALRSGAAEPQSCARGAQFGGGRRVGRNVTQHDHVPGTAALVQVLAQRADRLGAPEGEHEVLVVRIRRTRELEMAHAERAANPHQRSKADDFVAIVEREEMEGVTCAERRPPGVEPFVGLERRVDRIG